MVGDGQCCKLFAMTSEIGMWGYMPVWITGVPVNFRPTTVAQNVRLLPAHTHEDAFATRQLHR